MADPDGRRSVSGPAPDGSPLERLLTGFGRGLLLAGLVVASVAPARRLARSWRARIAVAGHSMAPALLEGDWLLVDPDAYRRRPIRASDLVVAELPPTVETGRLRVKRVARVDPDGRLLLTGDAPDEPDHAHGTGPLPTSAIVGRPWFRYWPPRRAGPVR